MAMREELVAFCEATANAMCAGVRLYRGEECLCYFSAYDLRPDPARPYLEQVFRAPYKAGVFTTPLFQHYGYLQVEGGLRILVGPSAALAKDSRSLGEELFQLGLPEEQHEEYLHKLYCQPSISAERMVWLMASLYMALNHAALPIEQVHVDIHTENHQRSVAERNAQSRFQEPDDQETVDVRDSFNYEKMLLSCIRNGRSELLRKIFEASPKLKAGEMAKDTLRQAKNMGICGAAIASREAIRGGMDHQTSFHLSDLYIQKMELLQDAGSVNRLMNEMFLDYAARVQGIKYTCAGEDSLFEQCASYVSQHLFEPIRVEQMAKELGFSRTYLCRRFSEKNSVTLSQYILNEKILEAQRLLQFTDKSLAQIAAHLSFSSQSHFQNSFKKVSGHTPQEFRKANR